MSRQFKRRADPRGAATKQAFKDRVRLWFEAHWAGFEALIGHTAGFSEMGSNSLLQYGRRVAARSHSLNASMRARLAIGWCQRHS